MSLTYLDEKKAQPMPKVNRACVYETCDSNPTLSPGVWS